MKLHATTLARVNAFTGYGEGYVAVNGTHHECSLLVGLDRVEAWPPATFAELAEAHFALVAEWRPELVLLGTGARLRFPAPALGAPLARAGIGLEVMDLRAACRTFNILAAEDRRVVAALVLT